MTDEYTEWIRTYLAGFDAGTTCFGKCKEGVTAMKKVFPELVVKRGHVHCPAPWGKRGHWWLLDTDGKIIDPTVSQFTRGILEYEEFVEGAEVRLGSCCDCGADIWGTLDDHDYPTRDSSFCNDSCRNNYAAYLNNGVL